MVDMVKLKIDGREVEAPKGKLLIEVCHEHGTSIPNFCYYPDLTPQASCRMCLVRIERMPKLATSCTVEVSEGMNVTTDSEEVIAERKGMLDFILGNHPLDCPVCDKGGECELQNEAFAHGWVFGHYDVEKTATPELRYSPFIVYDGQRCVRCYRCTRVCEEVMDVHALGKVFRGAHETIGYYGLDSGKQMQCEQCGYCVEVCPVGALLSVDSRFSSRPWDMRQTQTTCPHCADGCQLRLGVRDEHYVRAASKDLWDGVNGEFLCVKGRYGCSYISSKERLTKPLIRNGNDFKEATWEEALALVAARLNEIGKENKDAVAVLGSPRLTNEGNFALRRFAAKGIGTKNFGQISDVELGRFFANMTAPLATHAQLKQAKSILMIGGDPTEYSPLTGMAIRYAVRKHHAHLMAVNSKLVKIARRQAHHFLHIRPGAEAAVIAALLDAGAGNLSRYAELAKVGVDELEALRDQISKSEDLFIVIGPEVKGAALEAAAQLAAKFNKDRERTIKYLMLAPYNNSVGALDMGLAENGHEMANRFGSEIKALYIAGANPADQYGEQWKAALEKLSFLVVAELFMTDTARMADVVLPATSFAEQDGTFTNAAGQVQRARRALEGKGQARPDWMAVNALAREMGLDTGAKGSSVAIFRDIAAEVPGYADVTYERIKKETAKGTAGAVQTARALASARPVEQLLEALNGACSKIDASADLNRETVEEGTGLFKIGTLIGHSKMHEGFVEATRIEEEDFAGV